MSRFGDSEKLFVFGTLKKLLADISKHSRALYDFRRFVLVGGSAEVASIGARDGRRDPGTYNAISSS